MEPTYRAYGKIKRNDQWFTSPTYEGTLKLVLAQINGWFFTNGFQCSFPHAVYKKPSIGGSYECHFSVDNAEEELFAQLMAGAETPRYKNKWGSCYDTLSHQELGWWCPKAPEGQAPTCCYSVDFDQCDYCGHPEERK
jgi:hypothetical protein